MFHLESFNFHYTTVIEIKHGVVGVDISLSMNDIWLQYRRLRVSDTASVKYNDIFDLNVKEQGGGGVILTLLSLGCPPRATLSYLWDASVAALHFGPCSAGSPTDWPPWLYQRRAFIKRRCPKGEGPLFLSCRGMPIDKYETPCKNAITLAKTSHCVAFPPPTHTRRSRMQRLVLPVLLASFWTICTEAGGESLSFIAGRYYF